jgi:hypothetical protein
LLLILVEGLGVSLVAAALPLVMLAAPAARFVDRAVDGLASALADQ